jgi:hypothetical protein
MNKKKNSSTTGGVKVKIKPAELGKIVQEDIYVPDEKGGKKLLKIKPRATPKMEQEDIYFSDRKGGKKLLKIKPRDLPKMKQEDTYLPDLYIENFENTEMPNFKKGGLVKSGKPKLAKKGWR